MGIFDRLFTVVKSNLNDLISKAENPKKMLEQIILDMNKQLAELKTEVAQAIADEKRVQKKYNESAKLEETWERRAILGVEQGNDNLAMQALQKQEASATEANEYKGQWLSQKEVVDKLKIGLKQVSDKIQEAQRKKNLLVARQKRAEAQSRISKTMSSLTDTSAFDSFARMEEKVNMLEAKAQADEELESTLAGSDVEAQFKALESSSTSTGTAINDKLATLKAKMGKS